MSLKHETLAVIGDRTVAYGKISSERGELVFDSPEEFQRGLPAMDFDYDSGYGCQEVFGTIVFTDGTWLTRGQYDGSEWWENHVIPSRAEVVGESRRKARIAELEAELALLRG